MVEVEVSEDEQYLTDESDPMPRAEEPSRDEIIQGSLEDVGFVTYKKQPKKKKDEEKQRKKVVKTRRIKKMKLIPKREAMLLIPNYNMPDQNLENSKE